MKIGSGLTRAISTAPLKTSFFLPGALASYCSIAIPCKASLSVSERLELGVLGTAHFPDESE